MKFMLYKWNQRILEFYRKFIQYMMLRGPFPYSVERSDKQLRQSNVISVIESYSYYLTVWLSF
jgi:hypothetical protein